MIRFTLLALLLIGFAASSACRDGATTKLQRDLMDDSTWETSGGDETPWEPAEKQPKPDEEWEKENAPLPGETSNTGSVLAPRRTTGVIKRHQLDRVLDKGLVSTYRTSKPSRLSSVVASSAFESSSCSLEI